MKKPKSTTFPALAAEKWLRRQNKREENKDFKNKQVQKRYAPCSCNGTKTKVLLSFFFTE